MSNLSIIHTVHGCLSGDIWWNSTHQICCYNVALAYSRKQIKLAYGSSSNMQTSECRVSCSSPRTRCGINSSSHLSVLCYVGPQKKADPVGLWQQQHTASLAAGVDSGATFTTSQGAAAGKLPITDASVAAGTSGLLGMQLPLLSQIQQPLRLPTLPKSPLF